MAETTADVRRDIEMTRERMSNTIAELERRLDVLEVVREHPWPAIAVAAGVGLLLSGSGADMRAAGAAAGVAVRTASAGRSAGRSARRNAAGRVTSLLDDLLSRVIGGVHDVLEERADALVMDMRRALGTAAAREPAGDAAVALPRAVPERAD